MAYINNNGRRKTAIARAYMEPGTGQIMVNGREYKNYFPSSVRQFVVEQAFSSTSTLGQYDLMVNVKGGGLSGQAEAIRLAIARCIIEANPEDPEAKAALKAGGMLTRDSRMVERKKFGHKKARKSFQFSKR